MEATWANASTSVAPPSNRTPNVTIPYEVHVIRYFISFIFGLIVIFGVAGNILTMIVLSSKKLNTTSTSFYLFALALVDLLYLPVAIIQKFFDFVYLFPNKARDMSLVLCRVSPVSTYFLTYFSCWLLVAVTLDRTIWVVMPFRAKLFCTRKLAMIITACIGSASFATVLHFFFTMQLYPEKDNPKHFYCAWDGLTQRVFPYIDLILAMASPFVIMLGANTVIILRLNRIKRTRNQNLGISNKVNEDKTSSLTTMLLSISFFFMVSSAPLLSYDIFYFTIDVTKYNDVVLFAVEQVCYTLWYLNYSVHFLLYCLSGPRFREEAFRLFGIVKSNDATTCDVIMRKDDYKCVVTTDV